MKYIKDMFKFLDKFLEIFNVSLMGIMAVSVIITVFMRYVLNITFIWVEELITFVFIATTYFGIVLCVKEKEHIEIDFFRNLVPGKLKIITESIITTIVVFTLVYLAVISFGWIDKVGNTLSSGLKLKYKYVYIMMPISFILSALYEIRSIIQKWFVVKVQIEKAGGRT
ncbi:hypothetical protein SH1V18_15940 [Vallitalea longa]|uniref:Tripartite ATP-independent periplasmic transporters DctQ component domain-containing protein n=1 Tax=Vallitalea longa TaxID=2936439 RepID=A0A9W5Y9M7_9FIRM|nr:TRAP transporter small permease [Vallitalea longa]GKX29114.1 hypothetical protein SH1V18_15940 [Vallitalea longa]